MHAALPGAEGFGERSVERLIGTNSKVIDMLAAAFHLQAVAERLHLAQIRDTNSLRIGLYDGEIFKALELGETVKRKLELRRIETIEERFE